MKSSWWIAVAGIMAAVLGIVGAMLVFMSDRVAPVITVEDTDIVYVKGDKDDVLLQGVTATDKKDGDVTDSIIVEGVVISKNGKQAKICYVAKDKSNNISRAYRIVDYSVDGAGVDKGENESAGAGTGNTEGAEKETSGVADNQQKPTQSQTQGNDGVTAGVRPVLTLKAGEATVKVGQTFNVVSYVSNITDDKDDKNMLYTRIIADGSCDTSKAGDYTLTVYCSDSDMNYSDKHTLLVHVVQ